MTIDWSSIGVAIIALVGTLTGSYFSNRKSQILIAYRLEQLEKKVDAHNHLIERTFKLEESEAVQNEQIKVINHRIEDLEKIEQSRGNDGK
jgi:hypothetical protein